MAYEPVTIREAAQLEVLLFVGLAWVVSLLIIYWGFQTYQFGRIIRDTPPEQVRSVAMGRTEVQGDIFPYRRIYDQPFSDGQCVFAEFEVEEYKETGDDDDKSWVTVQEDSFEVPFYINDGTGQILVEPQEETIFETADEFERTIKVDGGETPPTAIQEFLGKSESQVTDPEEESSFGDKVGSVVDSVTGGVFGGDDQESGASAGDGEEASSTADGTTSRSDQGDESADSDAGAGTRNQAAISDYDVAGEYTGPDAESPSVREVEHVTRAEIGSVSSTSRKRRYSQRVLPTSAETYVYGGATRKDPSEVGPGEDSVVIRTDPSTNEFIIANQDEFELAWGYTKRSILYMGGGIIASTLILALLAQILVTGPVYGIERAMPGMLPLLCWSLSGRRSATADGAEDDPW